MKQLLKDFNCNSFDELNKDGAFKMMLLNICNHRGEHYKYWKPDKKGFILITDEAYLKFYWENKDYKCMIEANIYS